MNEDDDIAAAEYVLGTLPADERARLASRIVGDPALKQAVGFWQNRLEPLSAGVAARTPDPEVWERIREATAMRAGTAALHPIAYEAGSNVVVLERRLARWRGGAIAAMALAAALAGVMVIDRSALPTAAAGARYVAVVDTGGREPALIAEVDTASGLIRVRSVTAQTPAGHSLELWHIPDGQSPRSLGVLAAGADAQTIRDALAKGPVNGLIAVTVENEGGSPSGGPTGPAIYSGRLIPVE